jgi:hypothetical protein
MRNRRHARLWRGVKAELEESERQVRQQATNKGVPHSASIALPLIFSPRSASRLTVLLLLRVALAVASMKEQDPDFGSLIGRFSPATAAITRCPIMLRLWMQLFENFLAPCGLLRAQLGTAQVLVNLGKLWLSELRAEDSGLALVVTPLGVARRARKTDQEALRGKAMGAICFSQEVGQGLGKLGGGAQCARRAGFLTARAKWRGNCARATHHLSPCSDGVSGFLASGRGRHVRRGSGFDDKLDVSIFNPLGESERQ